MRFRPFTNDELAVLACGVALAGSLGDMVEWAQPLLTEINIEMARLERQRRDEN